MEENENKGRVYVDSDYAVNPCYKSFETKETHTMITNRYDSCDSSLISSDTSIHKTFISHDIKEVLNVYDRDTNDKTLRFNGYQEYMDGNWYKVKEDGLSIYYFERGKVDE